MSYSPGGEHRHSGECTECPSCGICTGDNGYEWSLRDEKCPQCQRYTVWGIGSPRAKIVQREL